MKIILIGPQGSGKGTQAQIISKELEIPHISTGDLVRGLEPGELKNQVDEIINKGNLIPDDLMIKILKQRLSKPDTKKGFILDGFPRNKDQVDLLKQITSINTIIEINLSDKEAIRRIAGRRLCKKCHINYNIITEPKPENPEVCDKCGEKLIQRNDDYEDAVKERLETYHKETEPILNFYPDAIQINGSQTIEKISQNILNLLKQ